MISGQRKERLQYIRDMLQQLEALARAEKFDMVSYLVGMAFLEAHDVFTGAKPGQIRLSGNRKPTTQGG